MYKSYYNIVTDYYISDLIPPLVGEVLNYPLRNANDFRTPRTRTEICRKSCIPSSVASWNSLDSSVRDIDSFKRFKNTLKTSLFPKIHTSLSKSNRYLSVIHYRIRNGCIVISIMIYFEIISMCHHYDLAVMAMKQLITSFLNVPFSMISD